MYDGGFMVADGYGLKWIHRYDAEHRSMITFLGGGNALFYPMGLLRDGKGIEDLRPLRC